MDHRQLLDLVAASAYAAWSNSLSGNQSPAQKRYYDRMSDPQPGDMVLEVSNWKADVLNRVGRLVSVGMEDPPEEVLSKAEYDPEEWDGKPWPPYQERIWRITTIDGREFRWWNARFIVVPEDPFRHQADISPK